jgi:hypothetical protein
MELQGRQVGIQDLQEPVPVGVYTHRLVLVVAVLGEAIHLVVQTVVLVEDMDTHLEVQAVVMVEDTDTHLVVQAVTLVGATDTHLAVRAMAQVVVVVVMDTHPLDQEEVAVEAAGSRHIQGA